MDEKTKIEMDKLVKLLEKDLSLKSPDYYFVESVLESLLKITRDELKN